MNKVLEGMARAAMDADGWKFDAEPEWIKHVHIERQRAALLWLAEDFAVMAASSSLVKIQGGYIVPSGSIVAAALRAAAEGGA